MKQVIGVGGGTTQLPLDVGLLKRVWEKAPGSLSLQGASRSLKEEMCRTPGEHPFTWLGLRYVDMIATSNKGITAKLLGWRPSPIAIRLEAIASRLEAIPTSS